MTHRARDNSIIIPGSTSFSVYDEVAKRLAEKQAAIETIEFDKAYIDKAYWNRGHKPLTWAHKQAISRALRGRRRGGKSKRKANPRVEAYRHLTAQWGLHTGVTHLMARSHKYSRSSRRPLKAGRTPHLKSGRLKLSYHNKIIPVTTLPTNDGPTAAQKFGRQWRKANKVSYRWEK